jgi:hypothetical protein
MTANGTVKWFNTTKASALSLLETGGKDVFRFTSPQLSVPASEQQTIKGNF